jgi:hypothetical protein
MWWIPTPSRIEKNSTIATPMMRVLVGWPSIVLSSLVSCFRQAVVPTYLLIGRTVRDGGDEFSAG